MNTTSLRTQIILPKDLRDEIDRQRRISGESLAEYLRAAAKARLGKAKREKEDLKKLAREVVGAAKGTRTKAEVDAWIRQIREARKADDKHRMKRWNEAMRMHKKKHAPA